jgi:pyruvate dehydrogenase E2 component (dihydrolipoamide acetyltransferase)
MARIFSVPQLGDSVVDAEIVEWLVGVGERVETEQVICSVETAKTVVEVPSPYSGVLIHQGGNVGDVIDVGDVLAVIGEPGETWHPDAISEETAAAQTANDSDKAPSDTRPGTTPVTANAPVKVLPAVRRLAAQRGIDLNTIAGTGPGGEITEQDVKDAGQSGEDERVRMSAVRREIANHLQRSWREIPHVNMYRSIDGTALLRTRESIGAQLEDRVPLEAVVIHSVIPLLHEFPEFNAAVQGEELILKRRYDIGVAVGSPEGLMVPVVRGADKLEIVDLAREVNRLVDGTRQRTIMLTELGGVTFTVSNIGAANGFHVTSILPLGTTAMLSIGRAMEKPIARDGSVVIVPVVPLTLTVDHRAIDGHIGAAFMNRVCERLEALA